MQTDYTYDYVQAALAHIQAAAPGFQPRFGLVLGTGLSSLADEITAVATLSYRDIPHFPVSTVESHKGQLVLGHLEGIPVVAMAGRFHYYEGYSMKEVTFPIRVMRALGVQHLVISNAAGSTNADIKAGDLVFIRDHINLHAENPLRGSNDDRLGPRFPDMLHAYDPQWIKQGLAIAQAVDIRAHAGVYLGLQGPNLETPAEYRFAHIIGADVVGMSTVPEVLVARHGGLPVTVISVATNECYPIENLKETTVEEVIAVAQGAAPKMMQVVKELLRQNA